MIRLLISRGPLDEHEVPDALDQLGVRARTRSSPGTRATCSLVMPWQPSVVPCR